MDGPRKDYINEVTQTQKERYHYLSLIWHSQIQIFRSKYATWSNYRNQESIMASQSRRDWERNNNKMKGKTEKWGGGSDWEGEGRSLQKQMKWEVTKTTKVIW